MFRINKPVQVLCLFLILTSMVGCNGGGGGGGVVGNTPLADDSEPSAVNNGEFDPNAEIINACASPYYRALSGTFEGAISYNPNPTAGNPSPTACVWNLSLVLSVEHSGTDRFNGICDVSARFTSEILSAFEESDSRGAVCADLSEVGDFNEDLYTRIESLSNPPYPIDALMFFLRTLEAADSSNNIVKIYPVGIIGSSINSANFTILNQSSIILRGNQVVDSEWSGNLNKTN